ncbi:hypothetical protein [Phormidium sp. FACHB-1136]|uniref:hypothetical protein n=1 Tax=Phormidium sp. FACHB-1136 TaxID=2692848 RepID=UPI0016853EE6|nr:hypothetical protein [Phormidium sp. FACHB-1136]MBD2427061.1 hypothetical protein [Phormidium sp. FACHB-1136]
MPARATKRPPATERKLVHGRNLDTGEPDTEAYDKLVRSLGAVPICLPRPAKDAVNGECSPS